MIENSFSLNKECQEFYNSNYDNRYEILRNETQLKFLDYNLLQVIKTFHIKDKFSSQNINKNFFTLPEEYDVTTVLTHNLQIYLNGIKMDVMESDNEALEKLNNCHKIYQTNDYIKKIEAAMEQLNGDFKSKLNWSPEEQQKIFQKFGKIKHYGKNLDVDIEGVGIGLSIAKRIVGLHNGKICVESEEKNKGSTFYVGFPV